MTSCRNFRHGKILSGSIKAAMKERFEEVKYILQGLKQGVAWLKVSKSKWSSFNNLGNPPLRFCVG